VISEHWFLYKDDRQLGPHCWEELARKAETGLIKPADMIRALGMLKWTRADKIKGLIPDEVLFSSAHASTLPPPAEPIVSPHDSTGNPAVNYPLELRAAAAGTAFKTSTGLEPNTAGLPGVISLIIWPATPALAVLLMVKAYQYETFKLPAAGRIAEKQLQ